MYKFFESILFCILALTLLYFIFPYAPDDLGITAIFFFSIGFMYTTLFYAISNVVQDYLRLKALKNRESNILKSREGWRDE